jgi:hypothetical protein
MTGARVAAIALALTAMLVPAATRAQIVPWSQQTRAPSSDSAAWQRFHALHQPVMDDVATPAPQPAPARATAAPLAPAPAPLRTAAPRVHAQRPLPVSARTPSPAPAAQPTAAAGPRPQPAVATRHVVRTIHFGDVTPERSAPVWYGWGRL